MMAHALELAGVSPNDSACCACGFGSEMYFIQRYAQFGCGALVASSHESAQPVAPCDGMVSSAANPAFFRLPVWSGHAAPTTASPFLNNDSSSDGRFQYFLINPSGPSATRPQRANCALVSSYGSLIPRSGCVFER